MTADILKNKEIYDEKCEQSKLSKNNMEQYMYKYLNKRFGLKKLVIEYSTSIINGIKRYASIDNDIAFFAKVLQNKVDENFRYYLNDIKNTVRTNLRRILQEKNKTKAVTEINKI